MSIILYTVTAINVNRCIVAASLALLYYDYILTLTSEIRLFWFNGRLSWASLFFFISRYTAALGHIPVIVEFFMYFPQNKSCRELQFYHQILSVSITILTTILLIMRTYALFERSRKMLVFLLTSVAIAGSIACWATLSQKAQDPENPLINVEAGCFLALSSSQGSRLATAWGCIMAFDTMVFVLTVYRIFRVGRALENSLFTLMVRDGTIYFGILVGLYLCDIWTFWLADPSYKGLTVTRTNVISCTLMSRLMLNIRESDTSGIAGYVSSTSNSDHIRVEVEIY